MCSNQHATETTNCFSNPPRLKLHIAFGVTAKKSNEASKNLTPNPRAIQEKGNVGGIKEKGEGKDGERKRVTKCDPPRTLLFLLYK